ncbi:hypothetical protein [Phytohalomonas tamaricis]|uniref:hypothetical protein n=1 Tax=Phytohalomonas tamaricis TaxID=2081032 RepID=UPI000D0BDB98|nr:hypothetical protein [Phytohalomonas tamaricis]
MKQGIVLPTTRRGWVLFVLFIALIAAGCWPLIALVNHARVVFGLPLITVWAYAIVLASVVLMVIANRLLGAGEREDSHD